MLEKLLAKFTHCSVENKMNIKTIPDKDLARLLSANAEAFQAVNSYVGGEAETRLVKENIFILLKEINTRLKLE